MRVSVSKARTSNTHEGHRCLSLHTFIPVPKVRFDCEGSGGEEILIHRVFVGWLRPTALGFYTAAPYDNAPPMTDSEKIAAVIGGAYLSRDPMQDIA